MNNEVELMNLLETIHTDLGVITSFIIFFVVVILCYFSYKFFDMIFQF